MLQRPEQVFWPRQRLGRGHLSCATTFGWWFQLVRAKNATLSLCSVSGQCRQKEHFMAVSHWTRFATSARRIRWRRRFQSLCWHSGQGLRSKPSLSRLNTLFRQSMMEQRKQSISYNHHYTFEIVCWRMRRAFAQRGCFLDHRAKLDFANQRQNSARRAPFSSHNHESELHRLPKSAWYRSWCR